MGSWSKWVVSSSAVTSPYSMGGLIRSNGAAMEQCVPGNKRSVKPTCGASGGGEYDLRRHPAGIARQLERNSPPLELGESFARLEYELSLLAVEISANLMYYRHQGMVIYARPAIESLLTNADNDLSAGL